MLSSFLCAITEICACVWERSEAKCMHSDIFFLPHPWNTDNTEGIIKQSTSLFYLSIIMLEWCILIEHYWIYSLLRLFSNFFKRLFWIYFYYLCVCVCTWIFAIRTDTCWVQKRGVTSHGNGVTDGCETVDIDSRKQVWVLW